MAPSSSAPRSKFIVYALLDPRTEAVRYIGKSTSGLQRPRQHWSGAKMARDRNRHKVYWLRQVLALGLEPRVVVLESLPSRVGLAEAEIRWIALWRPQGTLTNISAGGEGGSFPKSPEIRERIRKKLLGRPRPPEVVARVAAALRGRSHTEEAKEKRLGALRPILASSGYRDKMAAVKRADWQKPEYRAKQQAGMDAHYAQPGVRERHGAVVKANRIRPEAMMAQAEAMKDIWSRPGYRQQMSATMKAALARDRRVVDENGVVYANGRQASQALGISASAVSHVLLGRLKQTSGHTFRYLVPVKPQS